MRIAYVNYEDLRKQQGGSVHFRAVAEGLRDLGHDVTIVSPRYSSGGLTYPAGVRGISWRVPGKNVLGVFWFELVMLLLIPYFRLRYRWDAMLVRGGGPAVIAGLVFLAARLWGIRVVLECNGVVWEEFEQRKMNPLVCRFIRFAAWQQAKAANRIIGVTRIIAEAYRDIASRPAWRCDVVPNGADPEAFADTSSRDEVRSRLGLTAGAGEPMVVGFVGNFAPWHAADRLAEAMVHLRDLPVYLVMIGAGENQRQIAEFCKANGLDRVILTGQLGRDDVPKYYQAMDVGTCLNAANLDGSPLKFFEYLAAGLPILASGFPQVREIMGKYDVGDFIEDATPGTIAAAIRRLYDQPQRRAALSESNRRLARDVFSWKETSRRVAEILAAGSRQQPAASSRKPE